MGFVDLVWGLWRGALLTAAIAAKHVFRGNPLTLFDDLLLCRCRGFFAMHRHSYFLIFYSHTFLLDYFAVDWLKLLG